MLELANLLEVTELAIFPNCRNYCSKSSRTDRISNLSKLLELANLPKLKEL